MESGRHLCRYRLAAAAAALLAPAIAAAAVEAAASDDGARMLRIAENVFVIEHDDATDEWPHGNTGVIVGRTGLFVIDSGYLPSRARADIELIRSVTDKPVRFLMTTHWHFDHNNGASAYRDAFPGVTLLAERNTARWIELNQAYWKALSTAEGSPRRAALADLGPAIAEKRRAELAELESLEVVTPTFLFDGRLSFDFEGTPIEIEDRGRANSPNDATIWLPRERVLFAGDILVRSPLPYVGASWPVHWAAVLRDLEALPAAAIVPGHGPVQADHAYTRSVRELLETTLERVEGLVRKGRSLAEVQDDLNLDDVRARVPDWNGAAVSAEDWTYTRRTLAERAFVGLRGQGGL
jgi:glyoxylase-like metal-dependent hydrolase (beta-lactamase superfamily II)